MALFTIADSSSTLAEITDISGVKTLQTAGKEIKDNYKITASVPVYDNSSIGIQTFQYTSQSSTITIKVGGSTIEGTGSYTMQRIAPITLTSTAGMMVNNVMYAANTSVTINDVSNIAWILVTSIGVDIVNTYSSTNYTSYSRLDVSADLATYIPDMVCKVNSTQVSAGSYTLSCPTAVVIANNSTETAYYWFLEAAGQIWQLQMAAGGSFGLYVPEHSVITADVQTYYGCARLNIASFV